jgi:Ser/Thr protein kinase RdoA (MazF antagonist)
VLAPYGLSADAVEYLGGGRQDNDGIVYAFRQGGRPMVVKILAWKEPEEEFAWTRQRYQERISFAFYLGDGGAPVVHPVKDGDGLLYRHSHDGEHGYVSYLMERVNGNPPKPDQWDDALLGLWGGAVGRMHALAVRYNHWRQSPQQDKHGTPQLGWLNEAQGFLDWCRDQEIKQLWRGMATRLVSLPVERHCFGFIHNDPHGHNVLYDGKALCVIDFDVANYHWFATDVSIALQSVLFVAGGMERPVSDMEAVKRFLNGFLAGYEREHHLDDEWLSRLDLFINYRRMLLFTVMQDWLDTRQDLKDGWKRMIRQEPQIIAGCL